MHCFLRLFSLHHVVKQVVKEFHDSTSQAVIRSGCG